MSSLLLAHGFSCYVSCSLFEVGSNSTTVLDPVGEAAVFFAHFDQLEINDLDPIDFWGFGPPYVNFHDFRVPQDCIPHL